MLEDDSVFAIIDPMFLDLPPIAKTFTAMLVMGARVGVLSSVNDMQATARAYGA
jgi:hypothetical protein